MQHLGVREHDVRVLADARPGRRGRCRRRRSTATAWRHEPLAEAAELVLGERLGREDEQRGRGAVRPARTRRSAPGSRATSPTRCRWRARRGGRRGARRSPRPGGCTAVDAAGREPRPRPRGGAAPRGSAWRGAGVARAWPGARAGPRGGDRARGGRGCRRRRPRRPASGRRRGWGAPRSPSDSAARRRPRKSAKRRLGVRAEGRLVPGALDRPAPPHS